jgi:hypothetical protein
MMHRKDLIVAVTAALTPWLVIAALIFWSV